MTKKEVHTEGRSVHRIDLSLPVVQTDSYEIFYAMPSSPNSKTTSHQKPLIDMNKKSSNTLTTRDRSPARLKHLTGPTFVKLIVDSTSMTTESISTMGDNISNPVTISTHSNRIFKNLPAITKRINKGKSLKDDSDRSRSSSGNRLLYESLGSFDECNINKNKLNNMWQNFHHPQLTSSKMLHARRKPKQTLLSSDISSKISNRISLDNLSQESTTSTNEQLYARIEQLTKNYFPAIQQIRHTRPSPEILTNRMYLHREDKKNFMPILSRTRAIR